MRFKLEPYHKPFNMILGIRIKRPLILLVRIFDPENKAVFIRRKLHLGKSLKFRFKLPIVSETLIVEILENELEKGKANFRLDEIKVEPDTKCPLNLTDGDKKFISFAKWVATNLKELPTGEKGTIYQSDKYSLLLVDKIYNGKQKLSTPARVGQSSGIIEASKQVLSSYTVPMIMLVLLHEYAHHYKNPEYGKKVSNEMSADLIALHIALNLGFDTKEAENCFIRVFANKKTDLNLRRKAAIREFIKRFKAQEYERCSTKKMTQNAS